MMPWVRLDDQFTDHPKVAKAGPLAGWLFVCGLSYCNRLLTDGYIPAGQVRKLADLDDAPALAERLVEVGLWEPADGGYQVHDYLDYQPSKEKVQATSEKRAEAGRLGGQQKASNVLARQEANEEAKIYPNPGPVPNPPKAKELEQAKASGNGRVPAPPRAIRDPLRRKTPEEHAIYEPELFGRLWKFWGKVGDVGDAAKAWDALRPNRDLMQAMRTAIDRQRDAFRWGEPGGQAQPHLATWIRKERWHMEAVPNKVEAS